MTCPTTTVATEPNARPMTTSNLTDAQRLEGIEEFKADPPRTPLPARADPADLGVGELGTRSQEFRKQWRAHNVRHHGPGFKTFDHPIMGQMTPAFERLEMAGA